MLIMFFPDAPSFLEQIYEFRKGGYRHRLVNVVPSQGGKGEVGFWGNAAQKICKFFEI